MEQALCEDVNAMAYCAVKYSSGRMLDVVSMDPLPGMCLRGLVAQPGRQDAYVNAVLQALLGIAPLVQVVVSCPISRSRPVMRALALIFDYFRNPATQQPEQEPVDAYPAFREVLKEFEDWGGEPDPAELLQWLLMRLHEETAWERKASLLQNWDESVVRRIVSGVLWLGQGFEGFDVLGAEVPAHDTTVEMLLRELVHSDAEGEVFGLQHAPPILTLYLNRGEDAVESKCYITKTVCIPTTRREVLESVMYDLRVAIVHDDKHPEKVSALVKHDFTWYHFEGGTFVPVGWENVASRVRDVSILIFARRSAEIPRIELRLPCNAWEFWSKPPPKRDDDKIVEEE
jgi:hypothetical protein